VDAHPDRLQTIDLTYHLRLGRLIVAEHAIPRIDVMTFTAGGQPEVLFVRQ
jgi:hypothetical protein